jgi:hypothetical protein
MPTQRLSPVGCGRLPGRKNPCLFEVTSDGAIRVLATFRGQEEMEAFLQHEPRVNQAAVAGASGSEDE